MAFIQCEFKSSLLGKAVAMNIILPQQNWQPGEKLEMKRFPAVYLLHGLSDDFSAWSRYSSIERYANAYNIAVVMPDAGRSFYTDAVNGFKYWTFISEELPALVQSMFPVSCRREENFAAGLSMGGYGALKLGLRCPEKFAAVAALSAVVDIQNRWKAAESASWAPELVNIFGSPEMVAPSGNDLWTLAQQSQPGTLPRILSICGSEDFMIEDNRRFNTRMHSLKHIEFHSYEFPGTHNWEFWDRHIRHALEFFFDRRLPGDE